MQSAIACSRANPPGCARPERPTPSGEGQAAHPDRRLRRQICLQRVAVARPRSTPIDLFRTVLVLGVLDLRFDLRCQGTFPFDADGLGARLQDPGELAEIGRAIRLLLVRRRTIVSRASSHREARRDPLRLAPPRRGGRTGRRANSSARALARRRGGGGCMVFSVFRSSLGEAETYCEAAILLLADQGVGQPAADKQILTPRLEEVEREADDLVQSNARRPVALELLDLSFQASNSGESRGSAGSDGITVPIMTRGSKNVFPGMAKATSRDLPLAVTAVPSQGSWTIFLKLM